MPILLLFCLTLSLSAMSADEQPLTIFKDIYQSLHQRCEVEPCSREEVTLMYLLTKKEDPIVVLAKVQKLLQPKCDVQECSKDEINAMILAERKIKQIIQIEVDLANRERTYSQSRVPAANSSKRKSTGAK